MIPLWNNLEPPVIPLDADLRWLLSIWFGHRSSRPAAPQSIERALGIADRLGQLGLLAHRLLRDAAASEVTRRAPRLLEHDRQFLARKADHEASLKRVLGLADGLGCKVALTGQSALTLTCAEASCDRIPSEITLLVGEADVQRISHALEALEPRAMVAPGVSLEPTGDKVVVGRSPGGTRVIVRSSLPFVRLMLGGRFAELEALARCGYLVRASDWGKDVWLPDETTLAAQLVASGVVVERFAAPRRLLDLLFDLQTLQLYDKDLKYDVHALIGTDVLYAEFDGLLALARSLANGEWDDLEPVARRWLNHVLASALSRRYRARLASQAEFLRLQRHVRVAWAEQGFSATMVLKAAQSYFREGASHLRARSRPAP